MKLLLYCTKAKPYLIEFGNECGSNQFDVSFCKEEHKSDYEYGDTILNGKIVAKCDFEVEEIGVCNHKPYDEFGNWYFQRGHKHNNEYDIAEDFESLLNGSCLNAIDLNDYLGGNDGYAIHIKNLHIFDEPRELRFYYQKYKGDRHLYNIEKAPQNMMRAIGKQGDVYTLISIKPEWLCKILNKQKTIEVRKVVLKEMLK